MKALHLSWFRFKRDLELLTWWNPEVWLLLLELTEGRTYVEVEKWCIYLHTSKKRKLSFVFKFSKLGVEEIWKTLIFHRHMNYILAYIFNENKNEVPQWLVRKMWILQQSSNLQMKIHLNVHYKIWIPD